MIRYQCSRVCGSEGESSAECLDGRTVTEGEGCIEKPLATLWRNYQQSTKPDVIMKLSVTNSGLKGFTKEHGLTEYWSHRITYCNSPPHYAKLFCWVYRHEGKKLKHELRCHAVLCTKESISKQITEELQVKLKQALVEFKKDRISKQNARLSLANSVYDNPSMPRRKIMLSVGALNYRPPLERSKSAPKLSAIEELCSEEDEEEAEMKTNKGRDDYHFDMCDMQTLDRRRSEIKSPRKLSCPENVIKRVEKESKEYIAATTDNIISLLVQESKLISEAEIGTSHIDKNHLDAEVKPLESIGETAGYNDSTQCSNKDSNYLVTDSDDGSVSSGCETASTVTSSDAEPSSLQLRFHDDAHKEIDSDEERTSFECVQSFNQSKLRASIRNSNSIQDVCNEDNFPSMDHPNEINHIPIGERNGFRRRSTYPPLKVDPSSISNLEGKFESLIDNLTDIESLNSSTEADMFKTVGDNDSACSDESGYSELLDGKDSIIGNTIMV
ncbi:unnamed protein product [Leptidea sinapis]|uniref:PID domain-containing protein n=1 Tax=Leptidea sinapis TaxID=189913 RepID=A0A5E4R5F5_9NEOP|nr:unnamed protein product [Leptidea sinapis]